MTDYAGLIESFVNLNESEWIEFKHNNSNPEEIGEYISALSNSAILHDRSVGYMVWGIEDAEMNIVGTDFKPRDRRVGNEELENWLTYNMAPRIDFYIREFELAGNKMVLFEIPAARSAPVRWKGTAFIRVGSYKKKLIDHPEKERALWAKLANQSFETGIAAHNLSGTEVLDSLRYTDYFELIKAPLPSDRAALLERLEAEDFIQFNDDGSYDVTNLGAIMFAKDLARFDKLSRKAIRIVLYKGKSRVETIREFSPNWGYASLFERLITYVIDKLPSSEMIGVALRTESKVYPEIAIRELVANAIIHQDFSIGGSSPMIEMFDDRIEITNPGTPLIDALRLMDEPPQSRNEKLAGVMRRCNICEERGSGIDKTFFQIELYQLPPPDFVITTTHTKVILFAPRSSTKMAKAEAIRACYWHACLQHVSNDFLTNTTLRKRLGIEKSNYPAASRIISDTLEAKLIKQQDAENSSRKFARYVPFWA